MDPRPAYSDNDEDDVPLHHKQPFGAGLKRNKKIAFVRVSSTENDSSIKEGSGASAGAAVEDFYLNLVLPEQYQKDDNVEGARTICAVCSLPVDEAAGAAEDTRASSTRKKHESSLAHQFCLEHSYPPSALDRSRMGLAYLSSRGWDPDSRQGLGIAQQGMQFPLKPKEKKDTFGLGLQIPKEFQNRVMKAERKLNAKQCLEKATADRKKHDKLAQMFYGSEDVEKHLGRDSST